MPFPKETAFLDVPEGSVNPLDHFAALPPVNLQRYAALVASGSLPSKLKRLDPASESA